MGDGGTTRAARVLPAELTRFIGRGAELRATAAALGGARLVTLVGVGGVGKTRIALRAAGQAQADHPDGVYFVELSGLSDPDLLPITVSAAVDLPERSDQTSSPQLGALISYLADKRLLLVLDTCEHLIDACARFAQAVLRTCPDVRILATSRQPLDIPGEHQLPILPLAAPDPDGESSGDPDRHAGNEPTDAMRLFVERAAAVVRDFQLTCANRHLVAQLCHRLEGIPLAIELAVVRLRALSLEQLLERLDDRFWLLTVGNRAAPPRHQTLRTAIDWSHQLCSQREQLLWTRLSVFAGEFGLRAAEEICADGELPAEEVLEHLIGLLDKAIVLRVDEGGSVRYRMLNTIREYGLERLTQLGEDDLFRTRHRDYYFATAARFATEWLSNRQVVWIRRLQRELPSLRAALEFCCTRDEQAMVGLRMATALWGLWLCTGRAGEGYYWLERLLRLCPGPSPARMRALCATGDLALMSGQHQRGATLTEEAAELALLYEDRSAQAYVSKNRGLACTLIGATDPALDLLGQARDQFAELGDQGAQAWVMATMGATYGVAGRYEASLATFGAMLRVLDAPRERWLQGFFAWFSGLALWGLGRFEESDRALRAALVRCLEINHAQALAYSFDTLGWVACATERYEQAARHLGTATMLWRKFDEPRMSIATMHQAHCDAATKTRGRLGEALYRARFDEGAALPVSRAVALAIQPAAGTEPEQGAWTTLTRREREVATLVAEGLSNRLIAERLIISKRTVDSHIEHILNKLDFASRTQIAALAARRTRTQPSTE